jgi:hypothetical protein
MGNTPPPIFPAHGGGEDEENTDTTTEGDQTTKPGISA